jgi:hypothetical protein
MADRSPDKTGESVEPFQLGNAVSQPIRVGKEIDNGGTAAGITKEVLRVVFCLEIPLLALPVFYAELTQSRLRGTDYAWERGSVKAGEPS